MKSTKDRILQTLLNFPNSTINDLAKAVGINGISARHHLTNLQVEGLVQAAEERHGVGRPRLVYSLTETGAEQFPSRYLGLTNLLLSQLKSRLQTKDFENLFKYIGKEMVNDYTKKVRFMTLEERLDFLCSELTKEGFSLEWEKDSTGYSIFESTCPYYHVSKVHPQVCSIDHTVISTILDTPLKKVQCIHDGDSKCSYHLEIIASQEN